MTLLKFLVACLIIGAFMLAPIGAVLLIATPEKLDWQMRFGFLLAIIAVSVLLASQFGGIAK